MIRTITDNEYLNLMTRSADHASFRNDLLINNLANVNTPGYKRRDTADFAKALKEAMNKEGFQARVEDPAHIPFGRKNFDEVRPEMVIQEQTRYRNDKSSVDVDLEMAELAKNGLRYQMYVKRIKGYFDGMKELLRSE